MLVRRCGWTRFRLVSGSFVLKPTHQEADGSAVTPRCPSCGARVPADAVWCGLCHQSLTPQHHQASTARSVPARSVPAHSVADHSEPVPGPPARPVPPAAEPVSAATLTGGSLPEDLLDRLVGELAAQESGGPIAGLGRSVNGPARQVALAAIGSVVGLLALLTGMWVLGQVLSG